VRRVLVNCIICRLLTTVIRPFLTFLALSGTISEISWPPKYLFDLVNRLKFIKKLKIFFRNIYLSSILPFPFKSLYPITATPVVYKKKKLRKED
jgi:hypothetical protein